MIRRNDRAVALLALRCAELADSSRGESRAADLISEINCRFTQLCLLSFESEEGFRV
jgi:hypothetical protein